eukprot:scaffold81791_cov62-Phaeocystis_antarctica.AAC.2
MVDVHVALWQGRYALSERRRVRQIVRVLHIVEIVALAQLVYQIVHEGRARLGHAVVDEALERVLLQGLPPPVGLLRTEFARLWMAAVPPFDPCVRSPIAWQLATVLPPPHLSHLLRPVSSLLSRLPAPGATRLRSAGLCAKPDARTSTHRSATRRMAPAAVARGASASCLFRTSTKKMIVRASDPNATTHSVRRPDSRCYSSCTPCAQV